MKNEHRLNLYNKANKILEMVKKNALLWNRVTRMTKVGQFRRIFLSKIYIRKSYCVVFLVGKFQ